MTNMLHLVWAVPTSISSVLRTCLSSNVAKRDSDITRSWASVAHHKKLSDVKSTNCITPLSYVVRIGCYSLLSDLEVIPVHFVVEKALAVFMKSQTRVRNSTSVWEARSLSWIALLGLLITIWLISVMSSDSSSLLVGPLSLVSIWILDYLTVHLTDQLLFL